MSIRFSIITPCLNAAAHIEDAIRSVQAQGWPDTEHIVVDGGSTDGTVEILRKYPHLKWVSEPDAGQADAMQKGFRMSTGGVIGYLNADDVYLEGAFAAVAPHFEAGEKFVQGRVKVIQSGGRQDNEWLNDPKSDFESMLRHWEPQAFCVNPAGYFYTREVQEACPFNPANADKMDLEFLLDAASRFAFKKIDRTLGVFNLDPQTKTARAQATPGYWWPENFPFLERFIEKLPENERARFRKQRDWGYQLRRKWTVDKLLASPQALEHIEKGTIIPLPSSGHHLDRVHPFDTYAAPGDAVILVHQVGKVASMAVFTALLSLPKHAMPGAVYHSHTLSPMFLEPEMKRQNRPQLQYDHTLSKTYDRTKEKLSWHFITLFRDPMSIGLSIVFELLESVFKEQFNPNAAFPSNEQIASRVRDVLRTYVLPYFDNEFANGLGIDIFARPFDKARGYSIVESGHSRTLVMKFEALEQNFSEAIEAFLGFRGLQLKRVNESRHKGHGVAEAYEAAKASVQFDSAFLDSVYGHKVVRHFYTDEEIAALRARWEKSGVRHGSGVRSS